MKKRWLAIIVVAAMLLGTMGTGFAATAAIESSDAAAEYKIIVINDRSLIAVSDIINLGYDVEQNGKFIDIKDSTTNFHFELGSRVVGVNEIEVKIDAAPIKNGNESYIPMAFFFEVLNYEVSWNQTLGKIEIEKRADTLYPVKFESFGFVYDCAKPAKTISSTAPSVTELLFSIGAGERIQTRSSYCDYPAEAVQIPAAGSLYDPSIEVIVAAAPEVLIAQTHFKPEVLVQLTKAGIDVVAVESPSTIDGMVALVKQLGVITGNEAEARAVATSMEQRVQRTRTLVKNIQHPNVYYVVGTGQWGEYTATSDTFINDVLQTAGLNNVAADATGWKYSLEKLVEQDPDTILGSAYNLDTMRTSENYAILSAVKNNQLLEIDENVYSRPAVRIIDIGIPELLKLFHPDLDRSLIE
jgi:iron complex transport system substrate-binding protein